MRIAVAGKGKSGKTILAGTLARVFAQEGADVLAIDDDHDPNLAVSLGVGPNTDVPALPDDLITRAETPDDEPSWEFTGEPQAIVEEYGIGAPDGVTLLRSCEVVAKGGHMGRSHATVALLLVDDIWGRPEVSIVDMTAGLEVFGVLKYVDVLAIVVQPSYKSLKIVQKLYTFAREYDMPDVRVIANDVRSDGDVKRIEAYCSDLGLDVSTVIANDDAIHEAEVGGTSPVDVDKDSPGVEAIRELADALPDTRLRPSTNQ